MLVNKEIARKLRDIGYREPTDWFYTVEGHLFRNDDADDPGNEHWISEGSDGAEAPDKSDVFKWFRDKGIIGAIYLSMSRFYFIVFKEDDGFVSSNHKTWEEAEDACILKMIQILSNEIHP